MRGRTVLITGATSGIGKATALGLARLGAHVAIAGRDPDRVDATLAELGATGAVAEGFVADLSSQGEVRRLADEVLERLARSGPARVVNVASNAHAMGRIDLDDLQSEHDYSGARAYNQSKLANVLFTYELADRLAGTSVTANAVHPGLVRTSFGAEDPGRAQRLLVPLLRPFMTSPARGAAASIRVASAPELASVTGGYFVKGKAKRSSAKSYDLDAAARLWDVSAELCALGRDAQLHQWR